MDNEKTTIITEAELDDGIETVTLINDEGKEENFWHVMTFPYEGKKYCALVPEDQIDDDEPEVFFVRIDHDKDGDAYLPVDNEVLLGELFEELYALLDEQDGIDDDE